MINTPVTSQANIMELPDHIVKKAREIVASGSVLPALIDSSVGFYVSFETDETTQSFGGFVGEDGRSYKIGVKK